MSMSHRGSISVWSKTDLALWRWARPIHNRACVAQFFPPGSHPLVLCQLAAIAGCISPCASTTTLSGRVALEGLRFGWSCAVWFGAVPVRFGPVRSDSVRFGSFRVPPVRVWRSGDSKQRTGRPRCHILRGAACYCMTSPWM